MQFTSHYNTEAGLSDNQVTALVLDLETHTLWIGTGAGLNRLDLQTYRIETTPLQETIRTLQFDTEHKLWAGTKEQGLFRVDYSAPWAVTPFIHQANNPYSLSHNEVKTSYVDALGTLWVGTQNGLNQWDATKKHFIHHPLNARLTGNLECFAMDSGTVC